MSREILQDIISDFLPDKFTRFFREKNRAFTPRQEDLEHYNDSVFKKGAKLGEIKFTPDEKLIICTFEANQPLSERNGKKAQYEKGKKILKETQSDSGIFIFYDKNGSFRFSLIYANYLGKRRDWSTFRRFTYFVSKEFANKTYINQLVSADFSSIDNIKSAFSLAKVTSEFYKEFYPRFDDVAHAVAHLSKEPEADQEAHDFALLFVIRIIFLGFIQKRGWLGKNERFLQDFLSEYRQNHFGKNQFYTEWIEPLFFEALSNPPGRKVSYGKNDFSKETEIILQMAPYLNGGLFKKKLIDQKDYLITDAVIKRFFEFLFSYNFTIEENTLYDEDLELNPEFLGIIFERLVNKADGAIYTPRTEVDLMCRLSLVKWLQQNLPDTVKIGSLYELFFRESGSDESFEPLQKDGIFARSEIEAIIDLLENVTVCDPAVGSGAFPVGMLHVLNEIEDRLRKRIGLKEDMTAFERKKRIISKSLYGVEVKEWAVWITQLRLWITLFIDAPDEMKNSQQPILPNLDFKIQKGDSLVQRIGSKMFPVSGHANIPESIKRKVKALKDFKIDFFQNKTRDEREIRHREYLLFEEILRSEIKEKEQKLSILTGRHPDRQQMLFREIKDEQYHLDFDKDKAINLESEIKELKDELGSLHDDRSLIWNIEFAEIFCEKGGFDIIIGNPPYVRQENIADPSGKVKDKKQYKELLAEMVRQDFPVDFPPKSKINAQSDLYTYFYIRALCLLNSKGIHTFICSNSWLDVGYGAWLQRFLLERAPVEFIIDNHAKRSFEAADVNTIISIIHAPGKKIDPAHLVKFVAFKKPFEEAIFTEYLLQIEEAKKVVSNDIFRAYPITVKDLKEAGTEYENETQEKMKIGTYVGNKWGGKYLRAPDIFFTILEKGKDKIVKLSDIAVDIKRNNLESFQEWFICKDRYLDNKNQFPFLHSLKDIKGIHVNLNELRSFKKTKDNKNIDYIKPDIISNRFVGERMFFIEGGEFLVNDSFFIANLRDNIDKKQALLLLNSTLSLLLLEVIGRKTFAVGVMYIYGPEFKNCILLNPSLLKDKKINKIYNQFTIRAIKSIFEECGINPKSGIPIEKQEPKPLPDRAELDNIVFDALDLTADERKDVYRAVCRLVWNRISKAKSI